MAHDSLASAQLSPTSQQVAECYTVVYPERPARSKVMQWLNRARRTLMKERGIKSDEMSEAIKELIDAGLLWPSIGYQRYSAHFRFPFQSLAFVCFLTTTYKVALRQDKALPEIGRRKMGHFEKPDESEQDRRILDLYNRVKRLEAIIDSD